jgi:hypothetical protein
MKTGSRIRLGFENSPQCLPCATWYFTNENEVEGYNGVSFDLTANQSMPDGYGIPNTYHQKN